MAQPEDSLTWDELQSYKVKPIPKLSILICSLESRHDCLENLLDALKYQIDNEDDVEILTEIDNGTLSIGAKRNKLLQRSSGDYIVYVDDDDTVEDKYLEEILKAIETKPDVVGIKGCYFVGGNYFGIFVHSIKHSSWESPHRMVFIRYPNHLNPVKRDLALRVMFPEISMGEDHAYSNRLAQFLETEVMIEKPIYNYMAGQKDE
jgi:glycosyltransferase involved in cell wall biosynthesis